MKILFFNEKRLSSLLVMEIPVDTGGNAAMCVAHKNPANLPRQLSRVFGRGSYEMQLALRTVSPITCPIGVAYLAWAT